MRTHSIVAALPAGLALLSAQSWTWTAPAKGSHARVCIYHLGMKAIVEVE